MAGGVSFCAADWSEPLCTPPDLCRTLLQKMLCFTTKHQIPVWAMQLQRSVVTRRELYKQFNIIELVFDVVYCITRPCVRVLGALTGHQHICIHLLMVRQGDKIFIFFFKQLSHIACQIIASLLKLKLRKLRRFGCGIFLFL